MVFATSSSTPRRCARRWPSPGSSDPGEGVLEPPPAPKGWVTFDAGPFGMGAAESGFAYDNERPRHTRELPSFRIASRPVSNASWMHFSEGGGYERREWWSHEGWAWKEEYDTTHHPAVAAGHPDAPACHVSWFEADAFARAHDARLPSEAEWERAATSGQLVRHRRSMGMDRVGLPALPGLPGLPLPRVLGGLLRRSLPRPAGLLVGDRPEGRDTHVPQLGSAPAASDIRRPPAGPGGGVRWP